MTLFGKANLVRPRLVTGRSFLGGEVEGPPSSKFKR